MVAVSKRSNMAPAPVRPVFGGVAGSDPAVVQAIGNTPLLGLSRFAQRIGLPPSIELWLKAEWANPGGSVKDRPALAIVRHGLASGQLGTGKTLLDATSGNTGIAYAMLGAAFGFPVELVIPESASSERKAILTAYGATIVYSDPYEGSNGAILMARANWPPSGPATISTPISTATPPIRGRTTNRPAPRSGSRPMAASRISWRGWAPPAP